MCPAIASGIVHGEALVSYTPPPPHQFFFLLGITAAQREIENNAYAKFWGGQMRCIIGDVQVAYWPFFFLSLVTVPEVFAIVNSAQFNFLLVSNVALLQ